MFWSSSGSGLVNRTDKISLFCSGLKPDTELEAEQPERSGTTPAWFQTLC